MNVIAIMMVWGLFQMNTIPLWAAITVSVFAVLNISFEIWLETKK